MFEDQITPMTAEDFKNYIVKNELSIDFEQNLAKLKSLKSGKDFISNATNTQEIYFLLCTFLLEKLVETSPDDPPRAIIMCGDIDSCIALETMFKQLARKTDLRAVVVHDKDNKVKQRIELYIGADIVIGNAKRICEMYFKNGINLKHMKHMFFLDSNEILRKGGFTQILRLNESINKYQKVAFYKEKDAKMEQLIEEIMIHPNSL